MPLYLGSFELLGMSDDLIGDHVRNTFDEAGQMGPCILLLDDLDCECKKQQQEIDNYN